MTGTATAKAVTMRVSASAKTKRDAIAEQRRKTVDEYGWLTAKLSGVRADLARLTDLAKVIREWGGESPADKNVTFVGNRFSCHLGPCGLESKIKSMDAVYESLGHEKFIKACSVTSFR